LKIIRPIKRSATATIVKARKNEKLGAHLNPSAIAKMPIPASSILMLTIYTISQVDFMIGELSFLNGATLFD
jgi:hypothetical protein